MIEDVTNLLAADRKRIEDLFSDFELASSDEEASRIIDELCVELRMHRGIEEVIFPSVEFEDDLFVAKTIEEHEVLQYFTDELSHCERDDREALTAKVRVLAEFFRHHVMHEEHEVFPYLDQHSELHQDLSMQFREFKSSQQRFIAEDDPALAS